MMGLSKDKVFTEMWGKHPSPFVLSCFASSVEREIGQGRWPSEIKATFPTSLLPGGARWLLPGQEVINRIVLEKPLRISFRNNSCTFSCHFTSPFSIWWLDPHFVLMLEGQQTRTFQGVPWSEVQLELFSKLCRASGCFRVSCLTWNEELFRSRASKYSIWISCYSQFWSLIFIVSLNRFRINSSAHF